jgi:serine/threonine protein kinase
MAISRRSYGDLLREAHSNQEPLFEGVIFIVRDENKSTRELPDLPLPLPERLSHYKIIEKLGTGGMATVYMARDTKLDRIVALKILRPDKSGETEWLKRFLREARAAANLNHPNIAAVYDIGEENEIHFISMEYVEGRTLTEVTRDRPLKLAELVTAAIKVCDALAWAHSKGTIHRDIKPANLMLTKRGDVKVLDFGLVKMIAVAGNTSTETVSSSSNVLVGSIPYMSPEQALGEELDTRTDIFSLGVTLYQLVTGQLPFSGANAGDTLNRIVHHRPMSISQFDVDVPPELERIVHKCLEKDREWRYPSADALMRDLIDLDRSIRIFAASTARTDSPVTAQQIETTVIEPETNTIDGHIFNDDLLMNENDLSYATAQFSSVIHVLDYPRLRQEFAQYERKARQARQVVRRLGLTAISFATLAVLVLATIPAWSANLAPPRFALIVEFGALGIASIAAAGLCFGPWKRRWLECRLMAEQLRQWHFQLLVRRGEPIEKSCGGPHAVADFKKQRDLWFDDFLRTHTGKLDVYLESLALESGSIERWLHDKAGPYSDRSPALIHMRHAYERLRLDRQFDYAVWKLRTSSDKPIWRFLDWPLIAQRNVLSWAGDASLVCALFCGAILIYGQVAGISGALELRTRSIAMGFVLMAGALRTIRNAMAPGREIERYSDYRAVTSQLRDRFKQTTDPKKIQDLMEKMEMAAVDEMKGFVRASRTAKFIFM